jgi:tRNA (guanosine-2'-O-)-methyltransferase
VALELADGAVAIHGLAVTGVCLVVGHEYHGLSAATVEACADVVFVRHIGRVGSPNVATATPVALYELRRRDGPLRQSEVPDLFSFATFTTGIFSE